MRGDRWHWMMKRLFDHVGDLPFLIAQEPEWYDARELIRMMSFVMPDATHVSTHLKGANLLRRSGVLLATDDTGKYAILSAAQSNAQGEGE